MSTFVPAGRFLAHNPKNATPRCEAKHGVHAQKLNLAGNRKNATPGNREETGFALQKLDSPELPEFRSSRFPAKSAFEPRNRVLLRKPENETPGPGEETGIAPRKPIPSNPLENRLRKPWSQGCRNGYCEGEAE
jgi:hypothetical protein